MDEDTSQAALQYSEELKRQEDEMEHEGKEFGIAYLGVSNALRAAMQELAKTKTGKMDFRGKLYATVALRVEMLRKHLGADVSIETFLVERNETDVVMKAIVSCGDSVLATGYAEEARSAKGVNSTSALENCETSAVGRALAALGLGGGEFASADELTGALNQQQALEDCIQRRQLEIKSIKVGLSFYLDPSQEGADEIGESEEEVQSNGLSLAAKAWFPIPNEDKALLFTAPSKGGPFTTAELKAMRLSEFRKAYYGDQ